ncbi:MAG: hypothetical protein RL634_84 [Bacteroidota bacterium]|jgi:hypothetical protein|nr:hypothetical protein [Chitinophagia bacterium]
MKYFLLLLYTSVVFLNGFAQEKEVDSSKLKSYFHGNISVTNNGISFIPSFSLGKPAAIFELSTGKKRLSFDPQLRWALNGKPWSFVFWWRYKLITKQKFTFNVGMHPSVAFRRVSSTDNGITKVNLVPQQFIALEFSPNYWVNKNLSFGMYYLVSHGIYGAATKYTNFITINSSISNIKLSPLLRFKMNPQLYYLKMDANHGTYFSDVLLLSHIKSPFSFGSIINKPFKSTIPGGTKFSWNLSLFYTFHKNYIRVV